MDSHPHTAKSHARSLRSSHPPTEDPREIALPASVYGALSLILRLVARDGYCWWMTGVIPAARVLVVAGRLHAKHHVFLTPHDRRARRAAGLPVAHAVFGPRADVVDGEYVLPFALLATAPLPGERLQRVASEAGRGERAPVVWRERYVLRQRPTGQWTWYLTEAAFQDYAAQLEAAVRRNDAPRVHAILDGLATLPLFHGVSSDASKLIKLAASQWAHRTRRSAGPKPKNLDVNQYLRRARPRRGVGGRVYSHVQILTLQDFHDNYANQTVPEYLRRAS